MTRLRRKENRLSLEGVRRRKKEANYTRVLFCKKYSEISPQLQPLQLLASGFMLNPNST